MYLCYALLFTLWTLSNAALIHGPYSVEHTTYEYSGMDSTDHHIDVWYPNGTTGEHTFISYVHGDGGGGIIATTAYFELFRAMSAFGYVIASPRACNTGCRDDRVNLPHDPAGFGHFYMQQLKAIDWAKNLSLHGDPILSRANFSKGVGIAGHSMGGQATLFSSSFSNTTKYDVRAAVMHHAYTHSFPSPTVPFLVFTGARDTTAPPNPMAINIFNAKGADKSHGIANKKSAGHHEPDILGFNNLLPQFSVAWFKIYLDKTPQAFGIDFEAMLFGNGKDSLCGGGDGDMSQCKLFP